MKTLLFALLALLAQVAAAANEPLPTDLLQFAQGAAQAAQLTPLQNAPLDPAASEVRIWIGFYNAAELKLVRLRVDAAGQVQGESFFIYPPMTGTAEKPYYDQIAAQCQVFNRTQDWEACRSNHAATAHWSDAYRAMQALGLWMPDISKLPSPGPKNGPTVLVELRKGGNYQAYAFNDPAQNKKPQAQNAAKLLAIADGLVGVKIEDSSQEEDRD